MAIQCNMSAGIRPQCFFYSLDRYAPLAMTKGTKWIIPQSLTTPALRATPPMEGNFACNGNAPMPTAPHQAPRKQSLRGWLFVGAGGVAQSATGGGVIRATSHEQPVTKTGRAPRFYISFPIATAVSHMRFENPHSLSYHAVTCTNFSPNTLV